MLHPPGFHSPPSRVATRNTRQTCRLIFFAFYDNQEGLFVVREFPHEVKMTSMSLLIQLSWAELFKFPSCWCLLNDIQSYWFNYMIQTRLWHCGCKAHCSCWCSSDILQHQHSIWIFVFANVKEYTILMFFKEINVHVYTKI